MLNKICKKMTETKSIQNKFSFEDKLEEVNRAIELQRSRWRMAAVQDMDYDDVAQTIRIHILKKWHLWDQTRPLKSWLFKIVKHQIQNVAKKKLGKLLKPCENIDGNGNPCIHNLEGMGCSWTGSGKKCAQCPFYKKWIMKKENHHNIKLAQSMDHRQFDEKLTVECNSDIDVISNSNSFHEEMKIILSPKLWFYYQLIAIEGYTINEIHKKKDCLHKSVTKRQLAYIKEDIIKKAKERMKTFELI